MSESKKNRPINKNNTMKSCYNCNIQIIDTSQKICHNCNTILNPNDLKWKNSFISFLCLLCLIPFIIAFLSILILNLS